MRCPVLTSTFLLTLVACGDGAPPVDAAGDYTLAITNQSDTCAFPGFMVGQSLTNTPFSVIQDGTVLVGSMGGVAGGLLDSTLGGNELQGEIEGHVFQLEALGTTEYTEGNCTYRVKATMDGTIDDDMIEGDVTYRRIDNGESDCVALSDCLSLQRFNGTRPPR